MLTRNTPKYFMRRQLSLTLFLLFTLFSSFAQAPSVTYYNKKGETVPKIEDSYFYRIIAKDIESEAFKYVEFYTQGDVPKINAYLSKPAFIQSTIGPFQSFYPNGRLYEKREYNNKNQVIDSAFRYYPNGLIESILFYKTPSDEIYIYEKMGAKTDPTLFILAQDSLGNKLAENGNGKLVLKNLLSSNNENYDDPDYESGPISNHKKNGKWVGKFRSYTFEETWKDGLLLSGTSTDSIGEKVTYDQATLTVEPNYPGGINVLRQLVANNFHYPREAIDVGVSGTIMISFIVEKNGKMSNFKISNDLGYGTGPAAIKALRMAKEVWKPGIQRGRAVRVAYRLPVTLHTL